MWYHSNTYLDANLAHTQFQLSWRLPFSLCRSSVARRKAKLANMRSTAHTPAVPSACTPPVLRGSPSLAECKPLFLTKSKEQQYASGPRGYSGRSLTRRKRSRQHLSTPRHVVSLSRMSPAPLHGSQLSRRLRAQ